MINTIDILVMKSISIYVTSTFTLNLFSQIHEFSFYLIQVYKSPQIEISPFKIVYYLGTIN